jgi:hypothetical protein
MYHPVRTVVAALHLHIVTQYGRVGWSGLVFGPEKLKRRLEGAPSPGLRCHPACQGSPIQGPDLPCHCPTFHGAGLTNPRRQVKGPSVGCGEQKLRFCRRDCTPPKEDAFEAPFRSLGVESRRKLAPSAPSMDLCLSHIKKSSGGASAWRVQAPPVCMYLTGGPSMSQLFIFGSLSSFEALRGTTGLQLPSAPRLAASLRHLHSRNPSTQVTAFRNPSAVHRGSNSTQVSRLSPPAAPNRVPGRLHSPDT